MFSSSAATFAAASHCNQLTAINRIAGRLAVRKRLEAESFAGAAGWGSSRLRTGKDEAVAMTMQAAAVELCC
jgi:hypothetical protein